MPAMTWTNSSYGDTMVSFSYKLDGATYSSSTGKLDGTKVSYDESTNTLTIKNATIENATFDLPTNAATIKFVGRNVISGDGTSPVFNQKLGYGLTIEGDTNSYALIDGKNKSAINEGTKVKFNSGTVYAKSTSEVAMNCTGGLTMNGGSVTAVSGTAAGIISYDLTLTGGTVIAKGSTLGIQAGGDVDVLGGALYVKGGIDSTLKFNGAINTGTTNEYIIVMTDSTGDAKVSYNSATVPSPDIWLCGFPVYRDASDEMVILIPKVRPIHGKLRPVIFSY